MTHFMKLSCQLTQAVAAGVGLLFGLAATFTHAQPAAVENELTRFSGHWRVIEMVEDGRAIPEDQMREWLPGGGVLEIVDYTVLFKSPVDGSKSTKSFRIDPTAYPKRIVIMERDATTGTGIYKFDEDKLVICVTNEASQLPTAFSAADGSRRTLLVMERFEAGTTDLPGFNRPLPPRQPLHQTSEFVQQRQVMPPPESALRVQPASASQPSPPLVVKDRVAGRILTDSEVRNMTLGTWRINDTEGSIDIVFDANGTFQAYRYFQTMQNFHVVFVPTPTASGNWSIDNGRLVATVTSSTRADRVNQSFLPSVRSISATDMILEDHLGRVTRAVKTR